MLIGVGVEVGGGGGVGELLLDDELLVVGVLGDKVGLGVDVLTDGGLAADELELELGRELGLELDEELELELELDELDELELELDSVGTAPASLLVGVPVGSFAVGVKTIDVPLGGPERGFFLFPPATATAATMRMSASTPAAKALAFSLSGVWRRGLNWSSAQ